MGNINLLSHRSRLANPTGHSRLTLRQKKRQSRLNVNATKQGRVWNMDISILAFSTFAHRKLKLGQSYQSEEKNSDMDTSPLLFCQVWSLFAACVCVFLRACASGHCVWCLERDPVKAHARSSAQILELSAATRNYKSLSCQMLSSQTTPPSLPCRIPGSAHLWSPASMHFCVAQLMHAAVTDCWIIDQCERLSEDNGYSR